MWPIRLKILNSREFFLHRSQHFPDRDICWQDLFITTFHNNNPELCSEIQRQHHISNKEKNHHTVSNWIHQDLNKENTKKNEHWKWNSVDEQARRFDAGWRQWQQLGNGSNETTPDRGTPTTSRCVPQYYWTNQYILCLKCCEELWLGCVASIWQPFISSRSWLNWNIPLTLSIHSFSLPSILPWFNDE